MIRNGSEQVRKYNTIQTVLDSIDLTIQDITTHSNFNMSSNKMRLYILHIAILTRIKI